MTELERFNPKLYHMIQEKPATVLDLKEVIMANEAAGDQAAAAEAVNAASDNM